LIRHPYSGRGIPLAWYITESSDSNAIRTWLRKLKEDGWEDPKNVILDNDDAEINAIRSIFPQSNVFLCWWHLKYAWRRWIRKNIEKNDQDNLFYDLEQLLNINDENNINSMIGQFEQKWANTPAKNYFNSYYKIKKGKLILFHC
jgi:transposase-like protein